MQHEQVHVYELACATKAPKLRWIGFSYILGFTLVFVSFIYNLWFYYRDLLLFNNTVQLVKVCFSNPAATNKIERDKKVLKRIQEGRRLKYHFLGRITERRPSAFFHDVVSYLGTDPPLANHSPAIVSVPPATEILNESPHADEKSWWFQHVARF